ncbi:MAG: hypothetical protein JEZ00_14680 [Anaerolineaceae bacterium]|nr:hypothetical protein [Anaerolineaceae bacterium]
MSKSDQYQQELQLAQNQEEYLFSKSGLPGPRSNLELLHVAAVICDEKTLRGWLDMSVEAAPENTPRVYLQCIAVASLGRFILQDDLPADKTKLRQFANDSRWRIRECTAMALQTIGKVNAIKLAEITEPWLDGSLHELRAVAAAWAEPAVLKSSDYSKAKALTFMDIITSRYQQDINRDKEAKRILKKGLEYCWSVVLAYNFEAGKALFEKWFFADADIQKIMLVNLKKNRLIRKDALWVANLQNKKGQFHA